MMYRIEYKGHGQVVAVRMADDWAQALQILRWLGVISPAAWDMEPGDVIGQVNDVNGGAVTIAEVVAQ